MHTVVLACTTIRDELTEAARETGCRYPFVWVESGLHLVTNSLRKRLQEELDQIRNADRVLLAFGFCGNAVVGLTAGNHELIIPRADDCISLLLESGDARNACSRDGGVYFLTRGWLEGEANIVKEYYSVLARFGPERTERIYRRMLEHYRFLGLIDTGAYDVDALLPHVNQIAAVLKLEARVLPGSIRRLKDLLSGPWNNEQYLIVPPFTTIDLSPLGFDGI